MEKSKTFTNNVSTVEEAVQFLNSLRLPLTLSEATAFLRSLWHSANLLSLYSHFFPLEYAASFATNSSNAAQAKSFNYVLPTVQGPGSRYKKAEETNGLYSSKELEFFRLVEEKLFPIYLDNLLEAEEREDFIYIPSFGPDWWGYEFEDLGAGWQLLLLICGSFEVTSNNDILTGPDEAAIGGEHLNLERAALNDLKGHQVDWSKLRETAVAREAPLAYLPLAFEMLDHATGNIFLDPTDEMPAEQLEWCLEDMDLLIDHYKEATILLEKVDNLLEWLTASPTHLQEVINLWNECLISQATPAN